MIKEALDHLSLSKSHCSVLGGSPAVQRDGLANSFHGGKAEGTTLTLPYVQLHTPAVYSNF